MPNFLSSPKRLLTFFGLGVGLAVLAIFVYTQSGDSGNEANQAALQGAPSGWQVGELRPDGLRIKPSGRSNSSAVLDPRQFVRSDVQRAYAIAYKIPATINKLYCWCGCENRGVHRSNLACFEDEMGVHCNVCRGTAEIAYRMMQDGVTDPGKIQAAVDQTWGPKSAG